MYLHFLLLRLKQGKRFLAELGIVRLVIGFGFLGYLSFGFWGILGKASAANLIVMLVSSTVLTIHIQRPDKSFLAHFPVKSIFIFITEYLALSSLFILVLLLKSHWLHACSLIVFSGFTALIPIKQQLINTKVIPLPFIMLAAFEWKSGIRKSMLGIVLLFIVAFSLYSTPVAMPLAIIVFSLIVSGFYMEGESIFMLETVHRKPTKIISHKVKIAAIHFFLFTIPFTLFSLVVYPEWWFVIVYALPAGLLIIIFAIILKYALYEPNQETSLNWVLIGFVTASFIVPFFVPVPFIMLLVYGKKAVNNLKNYL